MEAKSCPICKGLLTRKEAGKLHCVDCKFEGLLPDHPQHPQHELIKARLQIAKGRQMVNQMEPGLLKNVLTTVFNLFDRELKRLNP